MTVENNLCDYGCGQEAKHHLKNGKHCCSIHWKKCPKSRLYMKENNPLYNPLFLERWMIVNRTPECNEKRRKWTVKNNPMNKPEVREKHKKKMKTLSGNNNPLYTNPSALENLRKSQRSPEMREKRLLIGSRLDYKLKLSITHSKQYDLIKGYREYYKVVNQETNRSLIEHKKDIPNYNLRGRKHGYELDHKYSVFKAFENNIDPKIVGHWKNLEIKTILENHTKYTKCSIELNELLFLIKESEEK